MTPYIYAILGSIFIVLTVWYVRRWIQKYYDEKIVEANETLVTSHVEEVESVYKQMRGWRHDYKNHIQAMKAYLELSQLDELNSYLDELDEDLLSVDTLIKSGNVTVDAVLNSKLTLAESRGIILNAKAIVPKNIPINDVDLGIILGNLLSNAIEGSQTVTKSKKFIRVYIHEMKGQLYISVTNAMEREIKQSGKEIITTKLGKDHGFGLKRIDSTVKKYNGFINRQFEEGVFATEITLPL